LKIIAKYFGETIIKKQSFRTILHAQFSDGKPQCQFKGQRCMFCGTVVNNVKFELQGFKTMIREKQVVSYGRDTIYEIKMEQAALEESVTVVGQSPVIDTKRTQVGVNISEEMIMSLPTSRNPWVMMALAPGMMVDREDVGGSDAPPGPPTAMYRLPSGATASPCGALNCPWSLPGPLSIVPHGKRPGTMTLGSIS
jgi:hypothetical protein